LLHARPDVALQVLDAFIQRLGIIQDWFEHQTLLHFYASSLLLVYEGHSKMAPKVDVKMIDFSHVFPTEPSAQQRDENYLYGLVRIVEFFQKIRNDLVKRTTMTNGNGECAALLNADGALAIPLADVQEHWKN
jgi:hypothetical protein